MAPRARAQTGGLPDGTMPYRELTNSPVDVTNFNPEPFTGMAFDPSGHLWAVNPYGNTVVRYDGFTSQPALIVPTGLNPVSVATWADDAGQLRVLVVCNGTHGLFVHDPTNGTILGFMRLDSEPADLVVDPVTDFAYVSCQGDQTILQINLDNLTVVSRFTLPCGSRPGPMFLDAQPDPVNTRVYVAPSLTGNNTVPITTGVNVPDTNGSTMKAVGRILSLKNAVEQLDDHDVFRITPEDPSTPAIEARIEPVARGAGSLIFDIGRHPNGDVWLLSTDSLNGDPAKDTEAKLKGAFAVNQLVMYSGIDRFTDPAHPINAPHTTIDVDAVPGGYTNTLSLNQARTFEFVTGTGGQAGNVYVASAQSKVMVRFDSAGNRLATYQLPENAQCYDIILAPAPFNFVSALCLGSRTIQVFNRTTTALVASLPLGLDPTPDQIRRGRNIFLDGLRSKDGRFSCASCHPRGMSDLLGWPLRGDPTDEKDIMLTQSLLSIADTFPHHWRGERDLEDFKKAFVGLLGASAMPSVSEMDDFMAYVRSLQAPANPVENPRRRVDDNAGTSSLASLPPGIQNPISLANSTATHGQDVFFDLTSFNSKSCSQCHAPQNGTDSSLMTEGFLLRAPRAMPIEMAHLRQLNLRRLNSVSLNVDDDFDSGTPPVQRFFNQNGFGTLHDGREPTLLHFITNLFSDLTNVADRTDAFRFTEQFDQGISPAVHWAQRYVQGSSATIEKNIKEILIDGAAASKRWNDVVAIGRFNFGSGLEPARWWYDPAQSLFVSDRSQSSPITRTWGQMKLATQAGNAELVFIGLPPGNGKRFGVDHDRDGMFNGDEVVRGTDPWNPDSDGDGWPDGYEEAPGQNGNALDPAIGPTDTTAPQLDASGTALEFTTARFAKYHVRFSEDVKYRVTYNTTPVPLNPAPPAFEREYFCTSDTFVLTHDAPSTPDMSVGNVVLTTAVQNTFTAQIEFWDRANDFPGGTHVTANLSNFIAGDVHFPDFAVTGPNPDPSLSNLAPAANLHVTSIDWQQANMFGNTLAAQVKIKLDYNYGAPTYSLLENTVFPPGSGKTPFLAQDKMVFCTISVRPSGQEEFVQRTNFLTAQAHKFKVRRASTADDQYLVAPVLINPVNGEPFGVICSPPTDATESTTLSFSLPGVFTGDEVKVSVMGVVTPVTPGNHGNPGTGVDGVSLERSLGELQHVLLEDAMSKSTTVP
jgi:mono/diheme cytochrome c family protein